MLLAPLLLALSPSPPADPRELDVASPGLDGTGLADTGLALAAAEPGDDWILVFDHGRRLSIFPRAALYPAYVADPRRPTMSIVRQNGDTDVAGASGTRYGIRFGGSFPVVRWFDAATPERGVELDLAAGWMGQFDLENSTDNVGWDGLYALRLTFKPSAPLAFRIGVSHDSSHLGDEYIESTGATRIEYTREEFLFGASVALHERWRTYGEFGWAHTLRNEDLMERGRAQAGLEWQGARKLLGRRAAPYTALDLSGYQEDDWELNTTLQTGIAFDAPGSRGAFRFGVEVYDGRSLIGELFQDEESHVAFGMWLDL